MAKTKTQRAKGLTERDTNPNAGRDSEHAAEGVNKTLGKQDSTPKPVVILPFESTLAYVFKGAGGKLTAIEAARMAQDEDERLKKMVYAWDQATQRDKDNLKLEDLCSAADVRPDEFLGLVLPSLHRRNMDISRIIASMAHPKIVEAAVASAQTTWVSLDRQMLLSQSGFLPTKNGPSINIDNRKQTLVAGNGGKVSVEDGTAGLPSFEQDAIEGAQVLRNDEGAGSVKRLLPAPRESQGVAVPGEILDAEVVE